MTQAQGTNLGQSWIFAYRWLDPDGPLTLSLPEQIAARIGERIIGEVYLPGARIIEQQIADEFQVSRGPVREAFRILEREGLAQLHRNRGMQVTQLSSEEVRDMFEIRAGLYRIVAERLALQRSPKVIELHDAAIAEMARYAADPDGGDRYAETVFRLSLATARSAGNPRLAEMIGSLALQTLRYSKLGLRLQARRRESLKMWRGARDAIARGDVAAAVDLAVRRIVRSQEEALRLIQPEAAAAEGAA